MGIFFWKNNKQIDLFANALAEDLFSYIQPDVAQQYLFDSKNMPKKLLRKVDQRFNDVLLQVQRYSEANSLGIYGKARFQKTFNERLEELGFGAGLVKSIAKTMLLQNR